MGNNGYALKSFRAKELVIDFIVVKETKYGLEPKA